MFSSFKIGRWLVAMFLFTYTSKLINASETIIFNAIEKSASVFIANKLAKGLNKELLSVSTNQYERHGLTFYAKGAGYILESRLQSVIHKRPVIREHLFPTEENVTLLKKNKLKVILHVRDLRQRVVSFAHYHFECIARGNKDIINSYKKRGLNPFKLSIDDLIEIQISQVRGIVRRILGWLHIYKNREIPILITTYEEFHDNSSLFFEKILDFYDIPKSKFKNVYVPKNFNNKFRKGSKDEWRDVLTLDQKRRINDQIPIEFFSLFNWEE